VKFRARPAKPDNVARTLRLIRLFPRKPSAKVEAAPQPLTVTDVHAQYAQFVFKKLQQLGGRPADLDDLRQQVFIAIHQKLSTYDPKLPIKPWLCAICINIMGNYITRPHRMHEVVTDKVPEGTTEERGECDPELHLLQAERLKILDEILGQLPLDHRVVFVMFEIDAMPCKAIADDLGIPLGTVHSRLHNARLAFAEAIARRNARLPNKGERQ
jgi:RNA polymerase sigma-70 factor, ECF subfamily